MLLCRGHHNVLSYAQGGKEAQLGLPVSRPCDHQLVSLPGAQLFVIDTFVLVSLEGMFSK